MKQTLSSAVQFSRRSLLRVGGMGLLGLTMPKFLRLFSLNARGLNADC